MYGLSPVVPPLGLLGLAVLDPVVGRMPGFLMEWEKGAMWRTFQKQRDVGKTLVCVHYSTIGVEKR